MGFRESQSWRSLQRDMRKQEARQRLLQRLPRLMGFAAVMVAVLYGLALGVQALGSLRGMEPVPAPVPEDPTISKNEVRDLIRTRPLSNIRDKSFELTSGDTVLHIDTSIDTDLQNFILDQFERARKRTRGKPRYVAIVAMDPATGKILSMAGFDSGNEAVDPCLSTGYPAASIFKIVTAAAAVEECGITPQSRMKFNGDKYTLYRRQLKESTNRYTNKISFADSFAQSVNPVFGKLGSIQLGKDGLEKYALAFGFNRPIDFEAPLPQSAVSLTDDPYQWAEIACGFNRNTLISPLHGALLSGAILNEGRLISPTIIDQITDETGKVVYQGSAQPLNRAVRSETTDVLKTLMATTISRGTGSKSFRGYRKDPVLCRLTIGGKTGSIFSKDREVRLDWFVGFAEEKDGGEQLALSVLVGHEKYIGTKACNYARMVMKRYFGNRFAKNDTKQLLARHDQEPPSYKTR
ncbi:hypothetical protein JCM14469_09370 [Desulfatiferula olefinivorans]